ncbi:MAG: DUF349 domain-containing protein, partial [Natronospirillum sp.]
IDRHQAAQHLNDSESLQAVQRAAKGHDKSLYKIAKTRLQQLRAAAAEQAERDSALAQVKANLERLAHTTTDPLIDGKFLHLKQRLESFDLSAAEQVDMAPLIDQVTAHLTDIEAEKRTAVIARATAERQNDTASAADASDAQAQHDAQKPTTAQVENERDKSTQENATAEPALTPEPEPEPEKPALSAEALAQQAAEAEAEKTRRAEYRKHAHELRSLLRRGHSALKEGHLRQARGIWRTVETRLAALGEEHHKGLADEAKLFHEAMEKLADWQDFAVLPKKEELIDHMRLLADRHMHPQDKADAVQALQNEWRTLSQGGGGKHQELWETFHRLAEAAYAPCKDYFAEQAELQAVNAVKRRELITQLHQYLDTNDWHDPDWAEVEKVLRLAARDWRHYSPVKPREHRATEKAYHAIVTQIREQLNQEYDRNKEVREQIIADAEALRNEESLRTATEKLKELQGAWKQAGRTHRKDDQRLWQDFRSVCDELFARRDEQNQAFKSELDQHLSQALRIIARIEAATASPDSQVQAEALKALPEWQADFNACNPLPKARITETQQRFNRAVESLRGAKQQRYQQQQKQTWHALFERLKCLGELEAAMHQGIFDAEVKKQVAAAWEDGTSLPPLARAIDRRLKTTLEAFNDGKRPPNTLAEIDFRRRVVLLEVLTESATPAEDRDLRMQVQVERLAESMGQQPNGDTVQRAVTDWLQCPVAMPEEDYLALHARVENAVIEYFIK